MSTTSLCMHYVTLGGCFSAKMMSYQYRNFHNKYKTWDHLTGLVQDCSNSRYVSNGVTAILHEAIDYIFIMGVLNLVRWSLYWTRAQPLDPVPSKLSALLTHPPGSSHSSCPCTVWCCYNVVNFLRKYSQYRHTLARPWRWDRGDFLWVQTLEFMFNLNQCNAVCNILLYI